MRGLTVKELREVIKNLDDDVCILIEDNTTNTEFINVFKISAEEVYSKNLGFSAKLIKNMTEKKDVKKELCLILVNHSDVLDEYVEKEYEYKPSKMY